MTDAELDAIQGQLRSETILKRLAEGHISKLRNPDGPEAADAIATLRRERDEAREREEIASRDASEAERDTPALCAQLASLQATLQDLALQGASDREENEKLRASVIEECAKVADERERIQEDDFGSTNTGGAKAAADAIRALASKKEG